MTHAHPLAASRILAVAAVLLAGLAAPPADAELEVAAQRGGKFQNAVVKGDYAYFGQGATLLTIPLAGSGKAGFGKSGPEKPVPGKAGAEVRFSAPLPGLVNDLAIHGDTLYVSWDSRFSDLRLTRFSLADPSQPAPLGPFEVPGGGDLQARGIEVVGDTLYVLDGSSLLLFDLSGPAPVAGTPVTNLFLTRLHRGPNTLLACGTSVIGQPICRTYDISNPLAPVYEGFFYSSSNATADDEFAVSYSSNGFGIWDLSRPDEPFLAASATGFAADSGTIVDDHLLVSGDGVLRPWDLSDPLDPVEETPVPAPIEVARVTATDPVTGATLVLTGLGHAVEIDASFPAAPGVGQVNELPVGTEPRRLAALGSDLLLVGEERGLSRLDAKLATLEDVGTTLGFGPDAEIRDVSTDGTRALVTDFASGLYLVDFQTPDSPVILGTMPNSDTSEAWTALLRGDRAWALHIVGPTPWEYHLTSYDLTNPAMPQVVGVQQTEVSGLAELHLVDDLLYVADPGLDSGLRIFDVSGPVPDPLGFYDGCQASDVDVRQSVAAVNCAGSQVHLLDVSDPADPSFLASYYPGQYAGSGTSHFDDEGSLLYGHSDGIDILDVTDPTHPELVQRIEMGGLVSQILPAAAGCYWAVAENGGVALIKESGVLVTPQSLDKPLATR